MSDLMRRLFLAVEDVLKSYPSQIIIDHPIPFFEFVDICINSHIDDRLFIEADLEDMDVNKVMFKVLVKEWTDNYNKHFFYSSYRHDAAYGIIIHLFEHEDFTKIFKTFADVFNMVHGLMLIEDEVCGKCYSEHRKKFERIYEILKRRLKVSL